MSVPEIHKRDSIGEAIDAAVEAIKPLLDTKGEVKEIDAFDVRVIAEVGLRAAAPHLWSHLQLEIQELKEYRAKLYEEKKQQGKLGK